MSVVAWRLSTGTQRVLATFEPAGSGVTRMAFAFVNDLSATHAAVFSVRGTNWATELIDLENGERTALVGGGSESIFGSDTAIPYLEDDAAYWIDRADNSLVVYDIPSDTTERLTLGF